MEIQSTTSAVIDAAREYVAKGWGVVPLKAGSKVPSIPELQPYLSRHATREELTTWRVDGRFGGVGVVTGGVSGLVVLDADGKAGEAELQRRGHPPTPTASTPRGAHLFFRCPGGELPTKIRLARGLDLKADGGYVAAPP